MENKQLLKALQKVAKKAKSKVIKRAIKDTERCNLLGVSIAHRVFRESMDMFECGEMTWDECCEDMTKTFKEIDMEEERKDDDDCC